MPAPPPTAYARSFDFSEFQADNPAAPYPGAQDDAQFDALQVTTDSIIAALADVRRSDGALTNRIVTPDSLSQATLNLMGGYTVRGAWLTATAYAAADVVSEGLGTYLCVTAHTSGTFATDFAAGKWLLIAATAAGYTTVAEATTIANTRIAALAVLLAGSTMTGDLRIGKATPQLFLDKTASGQVARLTGLLNNSARWTLDMGNAALETGSNAGSNFILSRFSDAGGFLDTPLSVSRATGRMALTLPPTASADASAATELTTLQQVEAIFMGMFGDFAHGSAPAGWLLCYGQAVSRTTYAKLFAKLGTTHGTGDGSTTFNLPDFRGRARIGRDNMGGVAASRVTNAVSGIAGDTLGAVGGDQRAQQHTHTVTDPGHTHDLSHDPAVYGAGVSQLGSSGNLISTVNVQTASATTGITLANAGAGSSQNMQPSMVVETYIFAGTV